jgi:DNA-binding PadR family transcriptional regulator
MSSDRSTRATILGQLGLRAWRSYDLVKEMRRNLHYFWPRAESRIYATLKKLDEAGEAAASTVHTGARSASVWKVTAKGRRAIEAWLGEAPEPTQLDCDALVRVFLAPTPDHPAVRRAVDAIRAEAVELLEVARGIASEYDEGRAPFQSQVQLRAMVFDYLASWAEMRVAWAERATLLLDAMATTDEAGKHEAALAHLRRRRDALGLAAPRRARRKTSRG